MHSHREITYKSKIKFILYDVEHIKKHVRGKYEYKTRYDIVSSTNSTDWMW